MKQPRNVKDSRIFPEAPPAEGRHMKYHNRETKKSMYTEELLVLAQVVKLEVSRASTKHQGTRPWVMDQAEGTPEPRSAAGQSLDDALHSQLCIHEL